MRRALACLAIAAIATACAPNGGGAGGGGGGLPSGQLDNQIAAAIGDPTTCVLIAEAASGKVLYRYGDDFNCVRGLPACDAPGVLTAKIALQYATKPGGRFASCNSLPDGSRQVGWAEGPVQSVAGRNLVYSAMMEGQRALPGHEMNARLYDAFNKAGL
ncbi:MAG TPA: hypothetical protein VN814_20265 [Caulobacteraceae bacterium]|nr:hypothetical protein [Caulobacteraceae bacterium]